MSTLYDLQEQRHQRAKERIKDTLIYLGLTITLLAVVLFWFIKDTSQIAKDEQSIQPDYSIARSTVLEAMTETEVEITKGDSRDIYIELSNEKTSREEFLLQVEQIEEEIAKLKPLEIENPFANVEYQEIPSQQSSYTGKITMSDEDYEILLRITEAEAGGEDAKGKRMVVFTILNRVTSDRFPNTVKEVVYAKNSKGGYQYTPLTNGRYFKVTPSSSTKEAVDEAIRMYEQGEDETFGAEFFMAPSLIGVDTASSKNGANWQRDNLVLTATHGVHEFRKYP